MQTSLLLLIVRPSILNPVINFSTHRWPVKWNALGYTFALHIPFQLLHCWCNTCTNQSPNDMIHFISLRDCIDSSILTSLAFHHCLRPSAPSLAQASPPRSPSLQSLWLALHAYNWSIKPSLVLIFSILVTWLHVMTHMQLHHICEPCNKSKPSSLSWHELLTQVYLWTNHLCISYLNILVHLGCHSITKTKLGTFQSPPFW